MSVAILYYVSVAPVVLWFQSYYNDINVSVKQEIL